jgi:hypothetical protein
MGGRIAVGAGGVKRHDGASDRSWSKMVKCSLGHDGLCLEGRVR